MGTVVCIRRSQAGRSAGAHPPHCGRQMHLTPINGRELLSASSSQLFQPALLGCSGQVYVWSSARCVRDPETGYLCLSNADNIARLRKHWRPFQSSGFCDECRASYKTIALNKGWLGYRLQAAGIEMLGWLEYWLQAVGMEMLSG